MFVHSSVQSKIPLPLRAAYCASKHAIHAYFDSLRYEFALPPSLLPTPISSSPSSSSSSSSTSSSSSSSRISREPTSVTIVCPGYVRTNLSLNALSADGTKHGRMDDTTAKGYEATYVADEVLRATAARCEEVWIAPLKERLAMRFRDILPSALRKQVYNRTLKQLKSDAKGNVNEGWLH